MTREAVARDAGFVDLGRQTPKTIDNYAAVVFLLMFTNEVFSEYAYKKKLKFSDDA